jgi:Cof subfamily protein (haloacid dehalogenase superfamily)
VSPKIKLVAIDLDGTLLTSNKEVTQRTIKTLEKVKDQGLKVVIATGRPLLGLDYVIKDVPKSPYILTTNGARVANLETGEVILERLIEHSVVLKIFEILEKYDCVKEIFYKGQGYVPADELKRIHLYHKKPEMCEYARKTREPISDLLGFIKDVAGSADKAQGIFNDMDIREKAWQELNSLGVLTLVDSYYYNIEINAKGVDKGSSLKFLAERLGILQEEVMAIGDGDNDAWMLEYAGVGVAMANARDNIKEIANVVTLSNDEDGVAKILEEYILEK